MLVTEAEKDTWNNKSNFSGNYHDLIEKPESMLANGGNADTIDNYHISVVSNKVSGVADNVITFVV